MSEINMYNIDCMEFMKDKPDKFYDWCIVDPPYGIGVMSMNYTTSGAIRTRGQSLAKRKDYRKQSKWDVKPEKSYFDELFRISKNQIIWGGNYFSDLIPPSKSFIVWDKKILDAASNDYSDCEYAWCSFGVSRMFRFQWNGMLQGDMKNKEERFHPTQKPVALYEWVLKKYVKEGQKILDTHGGSGSICIACYHLGFDLDWCEIDKEYFDMAKIRFEKYKNEQKTKLFSSTLKDSKIQMKPNIKLFE